MATVTFLECNLPPQAPPRQPTHHGLGLRHRAPLHESGWRPSWEQGSEL